MSRGALSVSGLPGLLLAGLLPSRCSGGRARSLPHKGRSEENRKSRPGCAGCLSPSGSWSRSGFAGSSARRPVQMRTRVEAALSHRRPCSRLAGGKRPGNRGQRSLPVWPLSLSHYHHLPRLYRRQRSRISSYPEKRMKPGRRAWRGSRRRHQPQARRPRLPLRLCCSC